MQTARALDLGARAATLSERLRVVTALRDHGSPPQQSELDPVHAWRLNRLAERLADKYQQESRHRSAPARHERAELAEALTAYHRFERDLDTAEPQVLALLEELHQEWLPTYRAALDGWSAAGSDARATWRAVDVYYGRLAKACEPFLLELGRRLEADRAQLPDAIGAELVDDLQRHLHDRFALALAWAVEAAANVHRAQHGLDREQPGEAGYLAYLDATFGDAESYHEFFRAFPVLGRWLAHVTGLLADYGGELFRHLAADAEQLGAEFFGKPITEFRSVRLGTSDYHAGGRSVALLTVVLADGDTGTCYYKPRCLRSEAGIQTVLGRLRERDVVAFAQRPVLVRDGYGYEATIPAGRNEAGGAAAAAQVYRELGGYLALFYVLGGGDLHFENIIVCDGHAFVCDGETVFGVCPQGRGRTDGTMLDSVFKTGLLEWPRAETADGEAQMRVSGYAGGESYEMPVPVPKLNDRRLSFAATVEHRSGIQVEPSAANRVFLHGELVRPQDHVESIMDGFDRVHEWFERNPDEAIALLSESFAGAQARFINWGTQIYSQLLLSAQHPKSLAEPLEVDLLANTVRTFPRTWDHESVLAERETASMWRLDVPIFTADVHGKHLVHDHAEILPSTLDVSPLDHAAERIRRLSAENREQQGRYIAASLSVREISNAAFVSTSLDYAARIGERLCGMLRDLSAPAPWTSFRLLGSTLEEADIEGDLYQGSAGVAFFLAYLDELMPRPEFREAARRAAEHALAEQAPERIGAFAGIGGQLYLLTHLHRLWGEQELADRAVRLCDDLPRRIDADTHFDVLHGVAGLIPVLLELRPILGEQADDLAHRCAAHLLRHARERGDGLSWASFTPDDVVADLTGFSHGAGGIGWALILLGTRTGRADYIAAGRRAFAYEAQHFDPNEQDWYDLRKSTGHIAKNGHHFANAWCNGAAGIGLSRIASWALLGADDEGLLREAHQALSATMRNFPRLKNHTLCHGTAGNSELLVRFALLRDEPAFQLEANVQVRELWRSLDDAEHGITEHSADFFPGLMLGISGFGLHFLRIAHPERVPSVLLLDPPPSRP
ncbi:type 2 lanthipeptide synthetase LanM family protein [Saccharopolyspora gloriosae]|uniref:type 2 lanthipeptide synthetase LanM family protein n=1 Tax=Saccharopolyspora gloriosae TaxID=455344 RepID=UPI001FB7682B|nr:type 2 lanthipeptide synthetase LanM family protein [Saccharopolyspora gloriosae]